MNKNTVSERAGAKSEDKAEWPREIKQGNATVKIYRTVSAKNYVSYQVPDFVAGKRRLLTFADIADAEARAKEIALRTANVQDVDVLELRSSDKATYQQAVEVLRSTELLRSLKLSVGTAADIVARAVGILGGDRIIEACQYFAKKQPANLPQKLVSVVVREFIDAKTAKGKSVPYIADLEYRLGKLADGFQVNLSGVTGTQLQEWIDKMKLSPRSEVNFRVVLGTFFRFAVRRGYLPKDWDELDRVEKVEANGGKIEVYTPSEASRLLAAAPKAFVPALAIQLFAGLRSAEVERLDWSAVHLTEAFIELGTEMTKTASRRTVPISTNLAKWLETRAKKSGKVWPHAHDAFYDAQQDTATATKTKKLPAVDWKHNAARHSFISYRLAQTQDAAKVAAEAGNSVSMIHKHYKQLVRPADAVAWWAISPASNPNGRKLIANRPAKVSNPVALLTAGTV